MHYPCDVWILPPLFVFFFRCVFFYEDVDDHVTVVEEMVFFFLEMVRANKNGTAVGGEEEDEIAVADELEEVAEMVEEVAEEVDAEQVAAANINEQAVGEEEDEIAFAEVEEAAETAVAAQPCATSVLY